MNSLSAVVTIHLIKAQVASGSPLARATKYTDPTTGWVYEPNQRGTFSIISSCALTIGLCVWSALHLNIPSSKQTVARSWLRNIVWVLMGLFGPELVVFGAWRQYVSARTLQNKIGALKGSPSKSSSSEELVINHDRCNWSMVHSFYAVMGGFVFDRNANFTSSLQPLKSQPQRLTLTPRGIALLADCGLLPNISKKEIDDKSKADGIAKTLVCLQASWMVLQVIARVGYGLPVTLLEINTIGHVICCFSIYLLWWHKPRRIREPTTLRGEWVEPLCAFMWMSSSMSDLRRNDRTSFLKPPSVAELAKLCFRPDHLFEEEKRTLEAPTNDISVAEHKTVVPPPSSTFAYKQNTGYLGPIDEFQSEKSVLAAAAEPMKGTIPASQYYPPYRWRLALDAMHMFPNLTTFLQTSSGDLQQQWSRFRTEELLCVRASDWPSRALLSDFRGLLMGMSLWFVSIAYGGVHTAAWDGYFPSEVETWLWRSSSLYIMASGLLWLCINFLGYVSEPIDRYWDRIVARQAGWWSYTILGPLCIVCGLAYGFARIFLVVEALISLRSLPPAAYQTPNWPQLIPHL